MDSTCTILLNQKAGALHSTPAEEQICQLARDVGLNADVIPTRSATHMRSILRKFVAENYERVAVMGGDGTISLAVQELAHTKTALGIIPQGTFNNFANALHLPQDIPTALRVLKDGIVREVDLGRVRNRYFTEVAGVGLFADALAMYGPGSSKSVVRGLYTLYRMFFNFHPQRVSLIADGKPIVERAVLCAVANTYRTGTAMPIAPEAKVTDGELDVVIIGDLERRELIPYFRALRATLHLSLPKVTSLRAREVQIESRVRMQVHADDQIVGKTPVTISADPHALKVLVEQL